jgi:hypothetical protein
MREGSAAEHLGAELQSIVLSGRRLTLHPWDDGLGWEFAAPEYDDTEKSQGTGGSNNWAVEAFGSRYSLDFRERGWSREKEAREFFAQARYKFGGLELDSTIYTYMQGHAILEVAHAARMDNQVETFRSAMLWLMNLAARSEEFRSSRTKRVITVGDRSAALLGPGESSWSDAFADIGMGRRPVPRERILTARADLVRDAFATMRSGAETPLALLKRLGFRTITPVREIEWAGGKALWRVGDHWHPSTQPIAIGIESGGHEEYAPKNRGYVGNPKDKTHRKKGVPTVTEGPTSLQYDSPVYESLEFSIPPRSQRTKDVEIGGPEIVKDFLANAPWPNNDPEPEPTVDPKPPKPRRRKKRFGVS